MKIKDIQTLQREVVAWGVKQFPGQSLQSITTHLAREAAELAEKPGDRAETADCLLLLLQIADRKKMTSDELIQLANSLDDATRRTVFNLPEQITLLVTRAQILAQVLDQNGTAWFFVSLRRVAKCQDMTMGQLVEAAAAKLEINKRREWQPADKDGVHEHVRS